MSNHFNSVEAFLKQLQLQLIDMLEKEDGTQQFIADDWAYQDKGGGRTCVLAGGSVFERAGVNFSAITGAALPQSATDKRPELAGRSFKATGVSVVIHPDSPMIPTCHANFRFIEVDHPRKGNKLWWFGGGFDLTPYYGFDEDCVDWHRAAKHACDPYGSDVYPRFKKWCDDYFYLPHRQEPRGVGGIFFDDLNEWGFEKCFAFVRDAAEQFLQAYQRIVARRKMLPFSQKQKAFQLYRRGRYVEFNLLYDRGTLFGLQSKGRTESILMSMPPTVQWSYAWAPEPGSDEERLTHDTLQVREWV